MDSAGLVRLARLGSWVSEKRVLVSGLESGLGDALGGIDLVASLSLSLLLSFFPPKEAPSENAFNGEKIRRKIYLCAHCDSDIKRVRHAWRARKAKAIGTRRVALVI